MKTLEEDMRRPLFTRQNRGAAMTPAGQALLPRARRLVAEYENMVLEREEDARARGAKIYGVLAGVGMSNDAYHITAGEPEGEGGARAIAKAASTPVPPVTTNCTTSAAAVIASAALSRPSTPMRSPRFQESVAPTGTAIRSGTIKGTKVASK